MPLNTSLTGPLFDVPHTPESVSFLRSFERAQEQNSPLYLAQVQQAQKQVQELGFRMQRDQLEIDQARMLQQDMLEGKKGAAEIAGIIANARDKSNPAWLSQVWDVVKRSPNAETKAFAVAAEGMHKDALIAADRSEQNRLRAEAASERTSAGLVKTAADIQIAQAKLDAAQAKQSPQEMERDALLKYKQQERMLKGILSKPEDDFPGQGEIAKSMLDDVQTRIQAWEVQHNATQETIEATPGGGMKLVRGPVKTAASPEMLTTANLSKAQDSVNQSVMTIEAANRLAPLISSETVGPRAFVESWVNDRVLANFFPELINQKRVSAERFAAELRSTAIRELRSDGNISEKERAQILEAIPQMNNPIDSPARAAELVQATKKTAAIRAIVTSRRMHTAAPTAAVQSLEDTDLLRMADSGLITKQEAEALWKAKRQTQ